MSDHWIILIPTNPTFVPGAAGVEAARAAVASVVGDAVVTVEVSDHPELVDTGSNWEGARCPTCATTLDDGWWADRIDAAYTTTAWEDLAVTTPCCETRTSLNDLDYPWPVGFARFRLAVENPRGQLPVEVLTTVSVALGCSIRVVRRHV